MRKLTRAFIATAFAGSAACSNLANRSANDVVTRLDTAAIVADQTLAPAEKAERLALAGEQLTTPTGFMYADLVFDQALAVDASNARAQFYKALLKLPMALRGIMARLAPMAELNPTAKARYDEAVANLPDGGPKTFLFDGPADIRTEKELQGFVDELYAGADQFRRYLKEHKDLELTLTLNDWTGAETIKKVFDQCSVAQVGTGVFDLAKCNLARTMQLRINRADVEYLQQIAAGLQLYVASAIAYDATGSIEVARRHENEKVSNKQIWKELSANPDFGKLRNAAALKNVTEMGIDAIAGARWAARLQNELCPAGREVPTNRAGFLFGQGVCIHSETDDGTKLEDTLKLVDTIFAGQAVEMTFGRNDEITTLIRPSAVLDEPIADLKLLKPTFDHCDHVTAVADGSLGGAFPRFDVNDVLAAGAFCPGRP